MRLSSYICASQEERRASNTVLCTSENNDIANQSIDMSFLTTDKKQSAGLSSAKRLFLSRSFLARKSRYVHNKENVLTLPGFCCPFGLFHRLFQ